MPVYLKFYFWLLLISGGVLTLERLLPRSRTQELLRPGFVQDLFWMIFNLQYASWMLAIAAVHTVAWFNRAFFHIGLPYPESLTLIAAWPLWLQFVTFFVLKDFLEWNIHRAFHLVPRLWEFHKLHHSAEHLDWAATFRAHWFELVVYKISIYLPLVILGVNETVIFWILVVSLTINELSHANLDFDYGWLRYVINSPRFHAWHHDFEMHGRGGQNFGVSFVLWDWLFRTAHAPQTAKRPAKFGFKDIHVYPKGIWHRLWHPFGPRRRPPR